MKGEGRLQRWALRIAAFLLGYVLLAGLTAPIWFHLEPPRSMPSALAFFTLLPPGILLMYMAGELAFAPWRELPRWARIAKIALLIVVPLAFLVTVRRS